MTERAFLPFVKQHTDFSCGAAILRSIAMRFGVGPDSEADFRKLLNADPETGVEIGAILDLSDALGLQTSYYKGMTDDELRAELDAGRPVILGIQAHGEPGGYETTDDAGHYVGAVDYDQDGVYFMDPAIDGARGYLDWLELNRRWHLAGDDGTRFDRLGIAFWRPMIPTKMVESILPQAKSGDVALGGRIGNEIEDYLHAAMRQGVAVMDEITESAVKRMIRTNNVLTQTLFNDLERSQLTDAMERVVSTSNLLGRAVVRDRLRIERERFKKEDFTPSKPIVPQKAIDYFSDLIPQVGTDPLILDSFRRSAFTMAVATEQTLLAKVQTAITTRLQTGQGIRSIEQDIRGLMDEAGVTSRNPQYGEMVFRTNAMDSYNQGFQEEFTSPEVASGFPVWMYSAIPDSRVRPEHLAHNGKYYPNGVPFAQIRDSQGGNPYNCRCTMIPIYVTDWERLQAQGARVETSF